MKSSDLQQPVTRFALTLVVALIGSALIVLFDDQLGALFGPARVVVPPLAENLPG